MSRADRSKAQRTVETGVFLLSLALVLGTLLALVWTDRPWEPDRSNLAPTIKATRVLAGEGGTVVHFELENRGQLSVAEVVVEVSRDGDAASAVEQVFTHVPRGAKRAGVAVLEGPPGDEPPRVRVKGYQLP
jgi:uncharacterized protein (TIGR02588 family)